jgi:prophage regulatory protein
MSDNRADRILDDQEVFLQTALSRTTRWRLSKVQRFPAPVQISPGRIGWRESEVQDWIARRQPKYQIDVGA